MNELVNLAAVLACTVGISVLVGMLYAAGLRLWESSSVSSSVVHMAGRAASVACFAGCAAIVLAALWLMIPVFH